MRQGPLTGLKVVEFAGIGPGPFCGMLLADLGADVLRIDRKSAAGRSNPAAISERSRRSVALDLKSHAAIETCITLIERADAIIEGFRPGVMERLGLGPDVLLTRNPKLVYGRMTGWGQHGPWAHAAGHDINYIAISGALSAIGTADAPVPPLNLVGDYGGGALYLAFGLLAAVLHARSSGEGQVVDVAMTDGAASLMSPFYGMRAEGRWTDQRGANLLDGGAPFYGTYATADGKLVALGPIEPQFYALFRELAGLSDSDFDAQHDRARWAMLREKLAALIVTRSRDEWDSLLGGTDACYAPVLNMGEAPYHPHNVARETFVELAGVVQPAPAPRFSVTPGAIQAPPPVIGADTESALTDWGIADATIAQLRTAGAI
ncbi:MAG: CoA transferase [Sphingomonadales bacterium]|nr:MAG: CoA transferase [Sphingomonadales bacterium]